MYLEPYPNSLDLLTEPLLVMGLDGSYRLKVTYNQLATTNENIQKEKSIIHFIYTNFKPQKLLNKSKTIEKKIVLGEIGTQQKII